MKINSTDHQSQTQPHAIQSRPVNNIRSLLWSGVILGIGLIGSLDEILLHQLLQWHTFYVHTTLYWRIVSDGVFHLVSAGLLLGGGLRLAWQQPQFGDPMQLRALIAGMLLGMGGFNLYDGTIQHKLLQLHPVREGVPNLLFYDLAFNALALALLLLGWRLWHSLRTGDQRNSV
jgi:uncharacterized membrane protein